MKIKLKPPYGRIDMKLLKQNDITFTQKLIYSVIAVKQGESDYAKLTNIMIADAVGCSPRYVSQSISQMEESSFLKRISKGKVSANKLNGQYGMVELDMLITTNISPRAKYLYLIYCSIGNDYDANIWGRKGVCAEFHISNSTYQKAHKELLDSEILQTTARSSGNGIQTSNVNMIIRTEYWQIQRPLSWVPPGAFDLDKWCLEHFDEEQRIQPELVISDSPRGTEGTPQGEGSMQRTVTINSNHNSSQVSKDQEQTNESFTTPSIEFAEEGLNIALLEEGIERKLRSPKDAREAIDTLEENGFPGIAKSSLSDEIIEKAFKAFEIFKNAVESYGQDTLGYALNIQDLNRFYNSGLCSSYDDDEIEYHIRRVTELGFEKLNKPYIGFSYVINTKHGAKQPSI